ncbi:hypothetical protein NLJ89_g10949 [Agrocybe chaxingu]|uniref:Uncharacterized protein n=1 Tax=Agrocybe chaxingu TaxID=84603 RepID=A0A9W8JX73_9AGAR|nr:hypothetical protein NLJ89_g10949 [Agrocybe chaxingu]
MTSVVPKIVIKPRSSAPIVAPPANTESPPAERDSGEDEDEGDAENEDSQAMDVDEEGQGSNEEPTHAADDEDGDAGVVTVPVPRPRGRPRGSGRVRGTSSGASTPRARGRGRGRGRPRGRGSLLIRLPRRNEDDTDFDGEEGGSEDVERGEGTPMEGEEVEKEAPLGGGKPFRKILGQAYVIDGDEYVTEDDPKGDEKIDKFGNLLGGRRFKSSTFILPNRHPQRQYMLAIDAARTSGFRDSLYYFRKNLLALKLNATQQEKEYLINEGKLGSHLRTRSVTLVTARSAFKLHGSKMIFGVPFLIPKQTKG